MWQPDTSLEQLYEVHEHRRRERRLKMGEPAYSNWLRDRLAASLRMEVEAEEALRPLPLEAAELDDHIRERVEFSTVWGLRVPAYVLKPKGLTAPAPAVLAIHGHGYGSRQIAGMNPDGSPHTGPHDLHGNYALELVRRGFVVLVPEVIGFGDRRLAADQQAGKVGNSSCQTLASHLAMYGVSLAALRVTEAVKALDLLATLEGVDPTRIGCFGFSGGGLIAAYTAAIDERIRATVLCAFTNTFKDSIMRVPHCIDNYLPGVLTYAELPELLGLLAPRPLFIASGEDDPIFPVDGVRKALAFLEERYAALGASGSLGSHLYAGVHEVNGSQAYSWLAGALRS
ncbi:alpha/beta hydrolase family protein [Paenibacillus oryzisoli]|uniref:dienelactone hydrolase family protein n=1 Tax=Paenibacillus oryzisoli TaxID=1850517 RepID=UPI003D26ADBD